MKSIMRTMTDSFDWLSTSLGPKENWPQSLKTLVEMMLNSRMPMHLSWGPDLIQFYNDADMEIIGDHHPILGKSFHNTWLEIHPKVMPLIQKVMSGESLFFEDYSAIIRRNGKDEVCHFAMSMSPVKDESGKISGVLTTSIEITKNLQHEQFLEEKRKLAEAQRQELHDLFMQAPISMVIFEGPEFYYSLANPKHDELAGRKTTGRKVLEVFSPEEVDHFLPVMKKVYNEGIPFITREQPFNVIDDHGKPINKWLDVGFYPYRDKEGHVKGLFGMTVDVTLMVKARKEIEHALASRDTFISITSHELKTPISSLKLLFQMMERNLSKGIPITEEQLRKNLDLSLRQISGLSRLIEDLLDATKVSNERMNFTFAENNLSIVIQDAIHNTTDFLSDHDVELHAEIEPGITMNCDPFRIQQVVTNLLTNAAKYGSCKPVFLSLKKTNHHVEIMVKDQGIGISKENQSKIFERFDRGSVTKNYAGLGLGLYISKHIIDAHHGTIHFDTEPNKGATFTVKLPL